MRPEGQLIEGHVRGRHHVGAPGPVRATELGAAVAASHLRHLPRDRLDDVVSGAQRLEVAPGKILHRAGAPRRAGSQGLVRVHASGLETRCGGIGVLAPKRLLAEAYPGPGLQWNTKPSSEIRPASVATDSGSATSVATATASPPSASMSLTVSSAETMSATTTRAPSAASRSA